MIDAFTTLAITGEDLWLEFTSSFRPCMFSVMSKTEQLALVTLLRNGGVQVERRQGYARARALTACYRTKHVPLALTSIEPMDDENKHPRNTGPTRNMVTQGSIDPLRRFSYTVSKDNYVPSNVPRGNDGTLNRRNEDLEVHELHHNRTGIASYAAKRGKAKDKFVSDIPSNSSTKYIPGRATHNLGVNGLMKALTGRKPYSGMITDDLVSTLEEYDVLCKLCGLTDIEKAQSMPIILSSDALSYYNTMYEPGTSSEEIVGMFKARNASDEQKHRIFYTWQSLRLSQCFQAALEKSESHVFHYVYTKLPRIQKQLDCKDITVVGNDG